MPTSVHNSFTDDTILTPDEQVPGPSNLLWTSIINTLPDGISVHSASGEILWANGKLCDLYSRPLSELKGLNCRQVFHSDEAECPHARVLATGESVQLSQDLHLSGKELSVTIQPLLDTAGKTEGFIRVMQDVTGERHTQEGLRNAERFASLGQLLSGVAHDVGTPLNVISGYAEFLLMRTKPGGQGYKELTAILDQTRRIAAVFGQALDLARAPQGRIDAIEIKALLQDSLDLVGHHLRRADVKASVSCTITPPLIYGEAPQLRQAFFNLLLNAGQRLGSGGSLQVIIDEAPDMPGFLGLTLLGSDSTGVLHDFSQSFGAFLSPHSEGDPTGIGLYLARKILDEAGVRIDSRPLGEPGRLRLYFPLRPQGRA